MDIRSPDLAGIFERERPDYVNHHAAQMDVRRSVIDPLFDADVNIRGSINLLECARQFQVKRVIYISTGGAVYGEPVYLPCDEAHPINPICPYGASKYTFEMYLFMFKELYGLDYSVIRYPNVYGPRQDPNGESGVVAIFIGQMLAGKPVTINGSGEQVREFVYVGDCAKAHDDHGPLRPGHRLGRLGERRTQRRAPRPRWRDCDRLGAHGPPLGLFPGRTYGSGSVRLEPGDLLVLYTDGITEASNPEDVEFGSDRLLEVVSASRAKPVQQIEVDVLAALAQFVKGVPYADDRTFVLLRREG